MKRACIDVAEPGDMKYKLFAAVGRWQARQAPLATVYELPNASPLRGGGEAVTWKKAVTICCAANP
jgi:hypothetical protein